MVFCYFGNDYRCFHSGRALIGRQQWGELAVSSSLWLLAITLSFLAARGVPLPNSFRMFFPMFERIYDFLGIPMLH